MKRQSKRFISSKLVDRLVAIILILLVLGLLMVVVITVLYLFGLV